ncbi:MAG: MFS transporter [Planctomycetota bacterium]
MSDNPYDSPQIQPTKPGKPLVPAAPTNPGVIFRLSVMMFLQFFVWGAWYVAMAGFLGEQGMSGFGAAAYTVAPIAAILAPLTIGLIADRLLNSEIVLAFLFLVGAVLLWIAPSLASPGDPETLFAQFLPPMITQFLHPMIICLLAYMLCFMPTLGLTASLSFKHLGNAEKEFPIVRVLGTIGWIVGGWVMWTCRLFNGEGKTLGEAQDALAKATDGGDVAAIQTAADALATVSKSLEFSDNSGHIFHAAAIASALLGLYCFTLPRTEPPSKGESISIGKIFGVDAWSLLAQPAFFVFALASFLICIPLAGYYAFGYEYVDSQGVNLFGTTNGAMSTGQMSEILFMLIMPLCFARLGVKNMLAIGMLAWVIRYGVWAWAFTDGAPSPTLLIFWGILLHGICYDFFFVTGMIYTDKKAPKAVRSQAQSLIVMLTQGLGLGIGAQLFGYWKISCTTDDAVDYTWFWIAPAIFAAVVMIAFYIFFWDRNVDSENEV